MFKVIYKLEKLELLTLFDNLLLYLNVLIGPLIINLLFLMNQYIPH